jgi:hypothetical protein
MDLLFLTAHWRALTITTSRRAVLAGIGGAGLSASGEISARKRGRRKRHKKRRQQNGNGPARVGATCPAPSDTNLGGFSGENRLAQTFTAVASGQLLRAELLVQKFAESTGDYVLRISPVDDAGFPSNEVLDAAIVIDSRVPDGESTVTFLFAGAASLTAGTAYALVLTRPGGEGNFAWSGHEDTCDGQAFASIDQEAPFVATDIDLVFTAFVRS